ncbi:lysophospholipase [Trametopsis cervina]|nr:lysophospholipase [Trametopsis cervina]
MHRGAPYTERWLQGPLETSFYTRLYEPPPLTPLRAVLVFIHGYLEHVGRYTDANVKWASRGVAVFAYDERGFGRTALDKDHKSPDSVYGRTGGAKERMSDIEWAVKYTKGLFGNGVPLFLMGHSMAGGMVLSFATRTEVPPTKETVALLSGVIASSPLIEVGSRKPSPFFRGIVDIAAKIFPHFPIDTPIQDKELSHDMTVGEEALKDPWIKPVGTARGIADMINRGSLLLTKGYRLWPPALPVLILHGNQDTVNAYPPTKEFAELLQASDKEFVTYEGAMHDLMTEPAIKDGYFETCIVWVEKHLPSSY